MVFSNSGFLLSQLSRTIRKHRISITCHICVIGCQERWGRRTVLSSCQRELFKRRSRHCSLYKPTNRYIQVQSLKRMKCTRRATHRGPGCPSYITNSTTVAHSWIVSGVKPAETTSHPTCKASRKMKAAKGRWYLVRRSWIGTRSSGSEHEKPWGSPELLLFVDLA